MARASAYGLVAADCVKTGGMDRANYALADYLQRRGTPVHLISHGVAPSLAGRSGIQWHRVPRPLGRDALGWGRLDRAGRRWARRLTASGGRVVVNGGNCRWGDVNWVHYVHAADGGASIAAGALRPGWTRWKQRRARRDEQQALRLAQLVIANSERTRRDLIEKLHLDPARVHTVYYGCDPQQFHPVSHPERAAAREALGWDPRRRTALFVGALGDRRKGFDTLWTAWRRLCADASWDVDLAVAGRGAELPAWRQRVAAAGLQARCQLLGFRRDIPALMAACDVLVSPVRYEAYGLGVQEALAAGLPVIVSAAAGVAERFPPELRTWLLADAESVAELEQRLRRWRDEAGPKPGLGAGMEPGSAPWTTALQTFGAQLRARTWDVMAEEMVALMERT